MEIQPDYSTRRGVLMEYSEENNKFLRLAHINRCVQQNKL
jgi:hypothetical protein